MNHLLKFWSLSRREKLFLVEAGILLLFSNLSIKAIAFRHIERFLRARWNDISRGAFNDADDIELVELSVSRMASLLPWKSLCLTRSIAEFIMLRRRGIPAIMYVGVRFSDNLSLLAHAWVHTRRQVANGNEDTAYTPLVVIGQEPGSLNSGLKSFR